MSDWTTIDYFTDESLVEDPYPYFDELRSECPVLPLPHLGVVAVTGYDEASEIYRDPDTFSSCNSVIGPYATFPVPLEGDDVSDIVAEYRDQLPMHEHMVTMDPPEHTRERSLIMRLLTPRRLQDNEAFMWRLADRQLDEFVADGRCEFISAYAQPFAMLVVADVLGVPEEDHQRFREGFGLDRHRRRGGRRCRRQPGREPAVVARRHVRRVHRGPPRRATRGRAHRAGAGELPRRHDARGQLGRAHRRRSCSPPARRPPPACSPAALKHLAEHPELQDELRADREQIPDFLEEVLRIESPVKTDFRLTRRSTTVGGVDIAAGTPVMLLNGAANRDPRRFECPAEFRIDRPNAQAHIAFGRGAHSCPGGPLARVEGRVSLERILDRMHNIRLSEEHHGPAGRPPLRLRADVDPPRPHVRRTSSSIPVERRSHDEPRRRRHRRRVGHRSRRRQAVRRRRAPGRDLRPQRCGRERGRRRDHGRRRHGDRRRGRRGRLGVGRCRIRAACAPSSARSRSS